MEERDAAWVVARGTRAYGRALGARELWPPRNAGVEGVGFWP